MAVNNLKGLTIEIGGDTSKLSDALKGVNSEISNLQSNLRTVESAIKLDPSNIAAVEQKQRLLTDAVEQTRQKLDLLREAQRQADEQMANGVDVDQSAYRNLQSEIVRTESSLNNYTKQLDKMSDTTEDAGDQTEDLGDEVENAGEAAENANDGFTTWKATLANLAADAIKSMISACKDLAKEVVEVGMSFEKSMSNVTALSGATEEEVTKLEEKARELGSSTQYSASQVADAFSYMALAGWKTEDMLDGISGVLNLAAASGMDLAEAADIVTDYLSAFGLQAKDSARMADMLAYAQSNSNTTVTQLGEAYRNSAANMNAAGQDIETTTSLLAMMANQGLKGSEAGTALTAMMRDLTAKMEEGKIAIGDTAVTVMDANGNYRDMTDILTEVEAATQGMGDAERATALSSTFTADSIRGLNLILNAGTAEAAKFEEQLRASGGTAKETAAIMQDNLTGDVTTMKSAFEELALKLYDKVQPALRDMVQFITSSVIPALTWMINNLPTVGAAIATIIATIVAFNWASIITFITNVGIAISGLFATLVANPIGLVVAAVGTLATALVWFCTRSSEAEKAVKANAEAVTAFGDAVNAATPNLVHATDMLSAYGNSMSQLDSMITETENAITTILSKALSEQRQLRDDEIASIEQYNARIAELNAEKLDTYRQAMVVEQMKIAAESSAITQEAAAQYIVNLKTGLDEAAKVSEESYNKRLTDIYNFHQTQGTLNSEAYTQEVEAAKAAYEAELAESQKYYADGLAMLTENAASVVSQETTKWSEVGEAIGKGKKAYHNALAEMNLDTANAFLDMYTETVKQGGEISDETKQLAADMLAAFDDLPKNMQEAGKDALLGMVEGLEDEIPELENASEMSAQEIVDTIKDELDINSPSRVMTRVGEQTSEGLQNGLKNKQSAIGSAARTIAGEALKGFKSKDSEMSSVGSNMVEGIESGISSKQSWIGSKISSFAGSLVSGFKKAFQIASPSKVMRDQIGRYLAEGIGEGIEENADAAVDPMNAIKDDLAAFDGVKVNKSIAVEMDAQTGAQTLSTRIDELYALVKDSILPAIHEGANRNIYLDKRTLVGSMASDMDEALGVIAERRAVGAV